VRAPWLEGLPEAWKAVALRYLARVETGSRDTIDAVPGGSYPFIVRSNSPLEIDTYSFDTEAVLTAGDGAVGEVFHHIKGKFEVHQRVYVIHDFRGVDGRFFYYYFSSQFGQTVAHGGAQSTVASLRRPMFTSFPVAVPPLTVQRAIADYLDRETAQIDAFIAKNEELIALLTERRAALVADRIAGSATPAYGEKLGYTCRLGNGSTPKRDDLRYWDGGQFPWLNSSVVNQERVRVATQFVTDVARTECHLPEVKPGTIIVGLTGEGRTRGMATIVDIEATISQHLAYIQADPRVWVPDYLLWLVRSRYSWLRDASDANGSTKGGLTVEQLRAMRVERPDLLEQRRLLDEIESKMERISAALDVATRGIELARERRAALISAAVTGKIDVGVAA